MVEALKLSTKRIASEASKVGESSHRLRPLLFGEKSPMILAFQFCFVTCDEAIAASSNGSSSAVLEVPR